MTNITIAAPLAQALASRGYDALTPVQDAMLAENVAGRDLLVSAQTGSGKTVAFGLAIAPELLAGADELLFADLPLALVIAPTRELALQVAREFEWLYGTASAKIATCVGGMDYRNERRALDRGAHVVVGTPGRLRDHIERGSLKLDQIRAVVLDEADEMLDLGFEEDLGFMLAACPEDRRTLMFSATVPKEIEALARTYQKDALRIEVKGEKPQHSDIEYQAISVAVRDREHAIFNLLRYHEARTAIVFCKTRANVNHLFARMTNRGLAAVALSGELSQSERTHALQALRDGRARVCVATDVAARGIDLPGLELVIHADLPGSSETLLHRSGRTGRAGKKGISALVVTPAEFKKAQRLLQGAKVVAEWGKAPSAEDVQERDDARLLDHEALSAEPGDEGDLAATLLDTYGAERVAAAFIRLWREGRSAPEVLSDALPPPEPYKPRERGDFGPSVWFELPIGHEQRAEARWLLPKICDAGGITKDGIGAIRVQTNRTYVQIAEGVAGRFDAETLIDRDLSLKKLDKAPDLDAPRAPARAPRPPKPEYAARAPRAPRDEAPRERPAAAYSVKPPRIVEDDEAPVAVKPEVEAPAKPRWNAAEKARRSDDRPAEPRSERGDKPARWSPMRDSDAAPREAGRPFKPQGDRKPYARREEGDAKPYARKPYAKAEGADAKPFARKPYEAKEGYKPRSAGFKSHGGAEGAGRASGYKSHAAGGEGKPARAEYKPRAEGDRPAKPYGERAAKPYEKKGEKSYDSKPYEKKSFGDKPRAAGFKSHGDAPKAAPKPRANASDTSKRFVPPKKR